jgi:hypothetical protein
MQSGFEAFIRHQPIILTLVFVYSISSLIYLTKKVRDRDIEKFNKKAETFKKVGKGLMGIGLYAIFASTTGQWEPIWNSVFMVVTSITFFSMTSVEVSNGLTLELAKPADPWKIRMLVLLNTSGLIVAVSTINFLWDADTIPTFVLTFQACMLVISVLIFFIISHYTNLVGVQRTPTD